MSFSKQQLQKFADLIRLDLSEEQMRTMNVDVVFDWIEKMKKIDTNGVVPMFTPAEHPCHPDENQNPGHKKTQCNEVNVCRADIVTDGNIRDLILKNAPDNAGTSRGYLAVPKVMDE